MTLYRLRCKKAVNLTNVGVKFRKVSKSNICQSCGNPWSMGKYKLELKKTFKTAKIQKVLMKSKNSKKISPFNKHILERYSENKSNLLIKCGSCFKQTAFPTPLPPKEVKSVKRILLPSDNQEKKKCKKKKPAAVSNQNNPGKQQEKLQKSKTPTKPTKVTKPGKKQKFSRNQMKNISKTISNNASVKGSLQSFLSSVK